MCIYHEKYDTFSFNVFEVLTLGIIILVVQSYFMFSFSNLNKL